MKSKFLLLSIFVSFAFIVGSAYAGVLTVSPDVSKSLTENEQVTVTVTITNPSGTETNIVTELSSSPSWFSVVQCSTINSLSASQSGTSTCAINPTSTGSGLTLTARSEPQSGAGNSGTGSTSGINVASQSVSLTASISASSSVGTSTTFYVGTTVAAPSANDVANVRATISRSGQCEIDTTDVPAQQNLGNITRGTTKSVTNWKLTSSSASGTCTVTVNVVSDVGGSASPSKSITVGTPSTDSGSTSSSSSSGGGGAGTGTGTAKTKVLIGDKEAIMTVPSIAAKGEVNFSIVSQALVITEMKVKVVNAVSNIKITATKLDARPGTLVSDAPGVTNQYLSIDKVNISEADIEKVTMDFKVEGAWITSNNIDESTVSMYRYVNDVWNKLETVKVSDDSTNIYYQAVSPGLSVFAVAGESKTVSQPAPEETPQEKKIVEEFVKNIKKDTWKMFAIVAGFAIAVGAVIYFIRKKSSTSGRKSKRY